GWRMDTGGNGDAGHSDRRSDVGTGTGTLRSDLWPGGLEPEPEVGATSFGRQGRGRGLRPRSLGETLGTGAGRAEGFDQVSHLGGRELQGGIAHGELDPLDRGRDGG